MLLFFIVYRSVVMFVIFSVMAVIFWFMTVKKFIWEVFVVVRSLDKVYKFDFIDVEVILISSNLLVFEVFMAEKLVDKSEFKVVIFVLIAANYLAIDVCKN